MAVDRNAIKNAILTLVAGVTFASPVNGYSTWAQPPSRRLQLWNKVDPSLQPAAFVVQHRESYQTRIGLDLPRRYLEVGVWCYAPTSAEGSVGDTYLDIMEEGIENALRPDNPISDFLTLGGLAYNCQISREDGLFIRDLGDVDGQALLILPIRVLLP